MPPIRISRSRMTACPACSRHIRVAEKLDETQCPFCGVDLKSAVHDARTSTLTRLRDGISSGTGVIAASLASASLVVACSTEQQATPVYGVAPDAIQSDSNAADSGSTTDTTVADTTSSTDTSAAADIPIGPLYGLPAPDATSDAGVSDSGTSDSGTSDSGTSDSGTTDAVPLDAQPAEDVPVMPLYGMPAPDTSSNQDAGSDTLDAIDAVDVTPQPEYGIPPGG